MSTPSIEVGKVYDFTSERRVGTVRARVTSVAGEWVTAIVLGGMWRGVGAGSVAEAGDAVTMRDTLIVSAVQVGEDAPALGVPQPIPVSEWGRDHWSTFAYIETRIESFGGAPDMNHLRTDPKRHPWLVGHLVRRFEMPTEDVGAKYPTQLRDGVREHHDDWDCLDDAVSAGLLAHVGTGANPVYEMTDAGALAANALRAHKRGGGSFSTFDVTTVPGPHGAPLSVELAS